ncbi:hypothetical protein D3C85_1823330 [compost metagenome]
MEIGVDGIARVQGMFRGEGVLMPGWQAAPPPPPIQPVIQVLNGVEQVAPARKQVGWWS